MNPDYSKYTIRELEDILNNIDKGVYPERYEDAKNEYNKKLSSPKQVELENKVESIKKKENKIIAQFTISSLIIVFFTVLIIEALYSGTARLKTGPIVELAIDPRGFYFIIFLHAIFVAVGVFIFYKNLNNESA